MKSIFKSVAIISLFSVLTRFLGFLLRIFLSRTIGAEALGVYQVALSVFMVLLTVVSSGLTLIVSRMTASYRVSKDKKATGSLVSSALILSVAVSIILCIVVLIFKNLFAKLFTDENCINILIILLPSLIFSAVYSVFRGAMWGYDNYFALCISELFEMVVKIIFSVLLLNAGMSVLKSAQNVAWSFTFSCVLSAVFVVVLYFVYGGRLNRPTKIYKTVLSRSAPITGVRIVGSLVQPLIALILPARLILAGYTASQAMSIYGIALGMTFPLLFLPTTLTGALSTALVPDIAIAMTKNDSEHIQKRVTSSVNFALFISFLAMAMFVAVGDKIGLFLYGEALSGTLLQFSSWIMIPMGVTNVTSAILNSAGLEVKSFINYIIGGVFTFISIMWLTSFMGVLSLPFGMGISTLITMQLNLFMLKRKLNIKVKIWKNLFGFFLLSLPPILITSFMCGLLDNFLPLFFNLTISGLLGVGCYLALCLTFNVVNIHYYFAKVKEKFKIKVQKRQKR